jgi:transposase
VTSDSLTSSCFRREKSTDLRQFDTVCIEDLQVADIQRNHPLARRIAQSGGAEFRRQLEYKAVWYGKHIRVMNRVEPSSRLCDCGYYHYGLTLAHREWTSPQCGRHHARDVSAANNSKRFAWPTHETGRDTPGEPGEHSLFRRDPWWGSEFARPMGSESPSSRRIL